MLALGCASLFLDSTGAFAPQHCVLQCLLWCVGPLFPSASPSPCLTAAAKVSAPDKLPTISSSPPPPVMLSSCGVQACTRASALEQICMPLARMVLWRAWRLCRVAVSCRGFAQTVCPDSVGA